MFPTLRSLISKLSRPSCYTLVPKIAAKVEELEASQSQILDLLRELNRDEVPRNASRIYKIGPRRTALYLNELLPQVYLTLVSVLQGVALAVLVDEFRFDYWESNPAVYAYYLSSLLIIVAFWYSYLNAVLDSRWPFHILDTLLHFVVAAAQAVAARNVSVPSQWCSSMAATCIIAAIIYLRQLPLLYQLKELDLFEDPSEICMRIRRGKIIVTFLAVSAGVALLFVPVTASDPQNVVAASLAVVLPTIYIIPIVRGATKFGVSAVG